MCVRVYMYLIYSLVDAKNTIYIKLDLNTGRIDMYFTEVFEPLRLKCNFK